MDRQGRQDLPDNHRGIGATSGDLIGCIAEAARRSLAIRPKNDRGCQRIRLERTIAWQSAQRQAQALDEPHHPHAAPTATSRTPKIRIHLPIMLLSDLYRAIILICDRKHHLGYSKIVRPAYDYAGKSTLRETRS